MTEYSNPFREILSGLPDEDENGLVLTEEEKGFVSCALSDAKEKVDDDLEYARKYPDEYDDGEIEKMQYRREMYEKLEERINEQGN